MAVFFEVHPRKSDGELRGELACKHRKTFFGDAFTCFDFQPKSCKTSTQLA